MEDFSKTKNIVILGAGFCGINAAKVLARKLHRFPEYKIILVDKNEMHTYFADLYEVGTAFSKRISATCLRSLKDTVCLKIRRIVAPLKITFLEKKISHIDPETRTVHFSDMANLPYHYLVISLGSVANFFNISGLAEYSFTLKSIDDALKIDCRIDHFCEKIAKNPHQEDHTIVIGGGGFTGVEFAAELRGYINKLAKKYRFDQKKVKIVIIEALNMLLNVDQRLAKVVEKRLRKLKIETLLESRIQSYDGKKVQYLDKNQKTHSLSTELFVWTGGIRANPVLEKSFSDLTDRKELAVGETLETKSYPRIYAGGDNAKIINPKTGKPIPKLAQMATQQGTLIGKNIAAEILDQPKKIYQPRFKGFIVPLGGKYYLYYRGKWIVKGIIPFIMRKAVDLLYFLKLLPPWKAIRKWYHGSNIFAQND